MIEQEDHPSNSGGFEAMTVIKGNESVDRDASIRELLSDEVLDVLLERSKDEAGQLRLTGEGSMLGQLVKAVLERALEGELTAHLGYGKHDQAGNNSGNSRNGRGKGKTVQTGVGPVRLSVPRDRAGTFEPVLVPEWVRFQRRLGGRCVRTPVRSRSRACWRFL
jgi:putative transposase